jgi:anti-sigma B factor antagonist
MATQTRPARLHVQDFGPVTVATFASPYILDEDEVRSTGQQLAALVEALGRRHLILHFGRVQRLSSGLIGVLIGLARKMKASRGRVAMCGLRPELREAFELVGLPQMIPAYGSQEEALQSFVGVREARD